MEKKPCIELHFPELGKRRDELVATGKYSPKEASIIAATEEHQRLFKDLQKFKKNIGVDQEKYVPFDSKKRADEVKKINDKYNPLIEDKKNGTKGELPLPKKEEPIIEGSKDIVREDTKSKSDAEIEKRMSEIQDKGGNSTEKEDREFDTLEKEMEKRERATVFNVPLSEAKNAIDALMKKEKEMPNGWGSFIERRDASESKSVIDDYSNAKDISDDQLKKDFKDAALGNPATSYADGLKLRESMKEAANRGIDINEMIAEVERYFEKDGFSKQDARDVVAMKLKPIFEGSTKVETDKSKMVGEEVKAEVPLATSQKLNEKTDAEQEKTDQVLNPEKKGDTTNEPPNKNSQTAEGGEGEGGDKIGVNHAALTDLAKKIGLPEPDRAEYITPSDYAERGRKLIKAGAKISEIDNTANTLHDRISIGRGFLENIYKDLNSIRKEKGIESTEYKDKLAEVKDLSDKIKKLGSSAGQAMTSLQGGRDIDTDNFESVRFATEEVINKPVSKDQEKKIQELTDNNEQLKKRAETAEAKLLEETEKAFKQGSKQGTSIKDKTKDIAQKIRQAKVHRPNSFSAATPASLVWDLGVETVAKSIEAGGSIAQAISDGVAYIRNSEWYKGLSEEKKNSAESDFYDWHNEQTGLTDLQNKFINKKEKDLKFTPEDGRSVWDYAKSVYLDRGVSFREMIKNVSNDTGLTYRQVAEAISTKKTKEQTDQMWAAQSELKKGRKATEEWVSSQNKGKISSAVKTAIGVFRGISVFGHGAIFVGTHAGATLFDPRLSKKTQTAFLNGWRFAYGKTANYELAMDEFKERKNYLFAQRAGLKNNPERVNVEEFQKSQDILRRIGMAKIASAGERGFNAIKVLRQDMFDYEYNKLSESERNDTESVEALAKLINNATGATNLKVPEIINEVTFAGGMEASRWGRLISNPAKAAATALEITQNLITGKKTVTASEKVFAKVWGQRVLRQVAVYGGVLAANALLQKQLNPQNPVNLTNPNKPDFLKFKFGNITIDPTSGIRGSAAFIYGLARIPFKTKKELSGDTKGKAFAKSSSGYLRGKLAPGYGTIVDFYTGQDFNGNTLPYSNEKPQAGRTNLSWGEYAFEKAPLPIAESATNIYKSDRLRAKDESMTKLVLQGIATGALSGSTGFRVGEYNPLDNKKKPVGSFTIHNPLEGTKRESTELEIKKFESLRDNLTKEKISPLNSDTEVMLNIYGDITISFKASSGKTKLYKDLTPEEKNKLKADYKTQATREAKDQLFGVGADGTLPEEENNSETK